MKTEVRAVLLDKNDKVCYNGGIGYFIDSHCHLHDREFFSEKEAEAALERARARGVQKIVCIGTSHEDSLAAQEFAEAHEGMYWTYGVHPENATVENLQPSVPRLAPSRPSSRGSGAHSAPVVADGLGAATAGSRCVAIGEVGLDYHYDGYDRYDRAAQIRLLEEMLQLAIDYNLPVSFHVREAFDDWFGVIQNFSGIRGVVHSFTDSKKVLRRILETTDFYIGVNGLATYSTLPTPPLARILLETDAPFLAPVPHRGSTNEPAYIADIAAWLAQKLEIPAEEVAKVTTANAEKLFKLD